MNNIRKFVILYFIVSLAACQSQQSDLKKEVLVENDKPDNNLSFDVPYEQFTLENGLNVILHQDKSDPIVAIATIVHVGSNREKPGRTGFAHFFEHMAFNNSENVPMGANRKMIPELGGTRNGGTWSDGTQYYEVVPKDAFEKLMWIDSDRFGYMINTVTEGTLEREKQVVKNEKRQRVDNRAYGHTGHVIKKALFPKDHPYNWTVIGDLEDLQNATLDDVREFYHEYYIPANATLVIAGDIELEQTKQSVEKWFGEIKASPAIDDLEPMPVSLSQTKKLYHLDNFAELPQITLTFPTVEQYHKDSYALDALGYILSQGKQSPFFTTLVEIDKLAPSVVTYNNSGELAGTFTISIRANDGVDLDDVYDSIQKAMRKFETDGIRDNDLTKIKAYQETNFYNGISSILSKAFQLGIYSEYAGDPAFIKQDIKNILAVTEEDVWRVYNQYIKDQNTIITSFVPKDTPELMVENSIKANVVEEQITLGKEKEFEEDSNPDFVKTPTKHDRSEPPLSELPKRKSPNIWHAKTSRGIQVSGIELKEIPIVNFNIRIKGGQLLDEQSKLGTAYLLAEMMNEGTLSKTPAELEDAIGLLGSSISVRASKTEINIYGSSLTRNYQQTMEIVSDMILNPRFDSNDFDRLKTKRLTSIQASLANPNSVAENIFMNLLYGDEHISGQVSGGNHDTVSNIKFEDVKNYYKKNFSINQASMQIVGDYNSNEVLESLSNINANWHANNSIEFPTFKSVGNVNLPQIFFIDFPDAKQSAVFVGKTTLSATDDNFNKLNIVNNPLGSGSSARLTQILRIEKGYTYGAYSGISSSIHDGAFYATTQVRSNVTLESLEIIKDQLENYHHTFSEEELAVTKNLIIKGNSRRYETLRQLMSILTTIDEFGYSDNYLELNQQELEDLSLENAQEIIKNNLNEENMIYVIVGDAKTQLDRLSKLGYEKPILLDRLGNKL